MVFHPGYATNRYFFLFYTANVSGAPDRLSRFETAPDNPNLGLATSELILINQRDEANNHNAGDLHFGPDGYLYVSLGDEGGGDGVINGVPSGNAQRITNNFFSGIIRIDVDKRSTNLPPNFHVGLRGQTNYFVPADNPFV